MRGEKASKKAARWALIGSPPHARGKDGGVQGQLGGGGITPAYAGKRWLKRCPGLRPRDHPRIRGEKTPAQQQELANTGSPPHARGKDLESPGKSTFLLCRTSDFI